MKKILQRCLLNPNNSYGECRYCRMKKMGHGFCAGYSRYCRKAKKFCAEMLKCPDDMEITDE